MLKTPLDIETLETCRELLETARSRKHPSLTNEEFVELQKRYRKAHWLPEDKPSGFFGHWGYSIGVSKLADPALDDYLRRQGIVVLPRPEPEPLHPYDVQGASGIGAIAAVERKAKLARKLEELRERRRASE